MKAGLVAVLALLGIGGFLLYKLANIGLKTGDVIDIYDEIDGTWNHYFTVLDMTQDLYQLGEGIYPNITEENWISKTEIAKKKIRKIDHIQIGSLVYGFAPA